MLTSIQRKPVSNRPSQAASSRSVINTLRQQHQAQQNKFESSYGNWFKPASFSVRLFDTATFALLLDMISSTISLASESANDYISNGFPAIVNGIGCIAPALIPFLPNIICLCKKYQDIEDTDLEDYKVELDGLYATMTLRAAALKNEAERVEILAEIKKLKQKAIDKFIADKANANAQTSMLDNVINAIYLLVRAVGGVLIMIKGCSDLDDDNSKLEEIGRYVELGSTAVYLICYATYFVPRRVMNYCQSRTSEQGVLPAETDEENSPTSQATLTSVAVAPQALFSPRRSLSSNTITRDSPVLSLKEPLLSSLRTPINA